MPNIGAHLDDAMHTQSLEARDQVKTRATSNLGHDRCRLTLIMHEVTLKVHIRVNDGYASVIGHQSPGRYR
jgi:hypothetical protein